MSRITKIWVIAAAAFVLYASLAWYLAGLTRFAGRDLWVLRGGLVLLGLVVAAVLAWWLAGRAKAAAAQAPPDADAAEIDAAVATAQQRLVAARAAGGAKLGTLPVVLVAGPAGAAKTTMLVRSGLEPELLAGEVFQGEQIVPTRLVNLWFVRGQGAGTAQATVFAEAGGQVTGSAGKRARLLQRLRPLRLGAALGRGAQAPRVAVVCFPVDELLKPGSSDAVPAAARQLRAALGEAAATLGIRLPVYVLFTKTDRVPGFAEYVQNLTRDEVREPLGATLPAAPAADGVYAERETARLSDAFRALFDSLAARRLMVLPRENAAERKPAAYEFPREFRKLAPLAVQFLVELGRPSQLAVSPFVRGFYFTGVRAVVVTESASGMAAGGVPAAAAPSAPAAGATAVFGALRAPGAPPAAAAPAAAPPSARKKPQWVFLDRLFPDVVLADHAAWRATQGGTRVQGLRRTMLAAAALLALVVGGAFTVSWLGNRGVERRTIAAARATAEPAAAAAAAGGAVAALPEVDELRRLDSLRAEVARLGGWQRDGAPVRLRWGLYAGDDIYPDARRLYFARFERALFGDTRAGLLRTLRALPDSATGSAAYGPAYEALKAYLITARHADRSTVPFLSPVLLRTWQDGRELDAERLALAQRQFDFYAEELARAGDPYAVPADTAAVERGRAFLRQYEGEDRIYQFMTSEAATAHAAVHFNRAVPGSAAFVVNGYEVPGAYTRGGWTFMQDALRNVDRFLAGEEWVLGPQADAGVDRRALAARLKARYEADFVRHWRQYLAAGRVVRPGGLADAARRLQALSAPQSPLLAMLALASRNTAVDSASPVRQAFQPVHVVTPPDLAGRYAGEAAAPYLQALGGLFAAVDQAAKAPPGTGEAAAQQAASSATQAKLAVNQVAQAFTIDTVAHVETTVQRLLGEPIVGVEPLLSNVGAGELNAAGARFCTAFGTLMGKYPFNPAGGQEATVDEVAGMFKPGTGLMWQYYDGVLQKVLARQGNRVVAQPGGQLTPNPAFVSFFNRAADFSAAVFRDGAEDPRLSFALRPVLSDAIPGMTVALDGQVARFTRTANDLTPFQWAAAQSRTARLAGQLGGGTEVGLLGPYNGPWALFRLFHSADRWQGPAGPAGMYTVEWTPRVSGQPMTLSSGAPVKVAVELTMGGLPPVLQRGWFDAMRCVSRVAQ